MFPCVLVRWGRSTENSGVLFNAFVLCQVLQLCRRGDGVPACSRAFFFSPPLHVIAMKTSLKLNLSIPTAETLTRSFITYRPRRIFYRLLNRCYCISVGLHACLAVPSFNMYLKKNNNKTKGLAWLDTLSERSVTLSGGEAKPL